MRWTRLQKDYDWNRIREECFGREGIAEAVEIARRDYLIRIRRSEDRRPSTIDELRSHE